MAKYRATVRIVNVEAQNSALAQRMVQEHLRRANFPGWQIVSIEADDGRAPAGRPGIDSGGMLLIAAAALALLFFLSLAL
jgi:hypothetical protein